MAPTILERRGCRRRERREARVDAVIDLGGPDRDRATEPARSARPPPSVVPTRSATAAIALAMARRAPSVLPIAFGPAAGITAGPDDRPPGPS